MLSLSEMIALIYMHDYKDIAILIKLPGGNVIANSKCLCKNEKPFENPIDLYNYRVLRNRKFIKTFENSLEMDLCSIEL